MVSVWKKDLEKHRQLLIVNRISCNELNHIHIAAIRGKIPITNMSVVIYCNGKYYLQIIAKKSWRYIIFAKKGINNDTIIIIE